MLCWFQAHTVVLRAPYSLCLASFRTTFSSCRSVLLVPSVEAVRSKTLWISRMTPPNQCENGMNAQDCSGLHVGKGGEGRGEEHTSMENRKPRVQFPHTL